MDKKLIHIVAKNYNNAIGLNNELLYSLPEDMQRFKKLTNKRAVIMGYNTYKSLKKPLSGRFNIVISREKLQGENDTLKSFPNVREAISFANKLKGWGEQVFIIGGGTIYKETLPMVDELYITEVRELGHGDVFYPSEYTELFTKINTEGITSCQIDNKHITEYQHWIRK